MEAIDYFTEAVQKLSVLYQKAEAEEIMHWVFEDKLLIKKAHLKLFVKELGFAEELALNNILHRLLNGEPIQYILGYAYFMDLVLEINSNVLIPRPETEELVNWCLEVISQSQLNELHLLDICTGSGCIALALQKKLPQAHVFALDISKDALEIASKNAALLKLPIQFIHASVLEPEGQNAIQNNLAQIWICNPPYITELEKKAMHQNVLDYEPHLALFVPNKDPLLFYRNILDAFLIGQHVKHLFFEISEFQKDGLNQMLLEKDLAFTFRNDLQGKDRMLLVSKK